VLSAVEPAALDALATSYAKALRGGASPAAVATTAAAWAMVALLALGARPFGEVARFDARFWSRIWRVCIAAAVMGGVLWLAATALAPYLDTPGWRYLALGALVATGIVVFFGLGQLIGAVRLSEFRHAARRR